jgi:5-methyltetrahydrofolate--homocysteine methyltransferase
MTQRKYTNRRYLDALEKKVLVFDGAMGTSLQLQNLTAEDFGGEQYNGCNDYLVISRPEAVEKVHRSFLDVGVDVLETDTFRSNRMTMGIKCYRMRRDQWLPRDSRKLADEYSKDSRVCRGLIGPSGNALRS